MEENYTIALDCSTKSTGIAIFLNDKLLEYKCITQSSKSVLKRIKGMTDAIEEIYLKYNSASKVQVIMEQVIPDNLTDNNEKWLKNQATFKALFYLQAAIVLMFDHYDQEVEFIGASTWRRICGIKQGGNANRDVLKARDKTFVKEHYFIDVNDDIADAICIGFAKIHDQPQPAAAFNWE